MGPACGAVVVPDGDVGRCRRKKSIFLTYFGKKYMRCTKIEQDVFRQIVQLPPDAISKVLDETQYLTNFTNS